VAGKARPRFLARPSGFAAVGDALSRLFALDFQ